MVNPPSQEIQVEVACSLACIVLGNTENQEKLKEIPSFKYSTLLSLLKVRNENIRLQAGTALAIFGFNNTPQQYAIREAGGISYSLFLPFLTSDNEFYRASASFQIVVLARVIMDRDQVSLTAEGVTSLVELLKSKTDNVVILSASLLSSLAHTRAGIPDAMVTSGAVDVLIEHLNSKYNLVRTSCAVALGYLSFNKTAARKLFSCCRDKPGLYDKLIENIDTDAKISSEFKQDFERAKKIGLPSQSLEKNGGPPACPPKRQGSCRPKTGMSHRREYRDSRASTARSRFAARAVSAPAKTRSSPIS
ncbi:ANKAR [Bugula neritina]|uniref:ANKAR n=1 Tax=Bugula neritina TaxID=10212 RepID=A0A7J7JZD3_BUGNE|nr:ANKAR [Bugula neritina]